MTSRGLKVLVLDQAPGVWGAQRYVLRLAPLLRELGMELVLGGPQTLALHDVWRDAGFEAVHLNLSTERSIRSGGRPSVSGTARESIKSLRTARLIADLVRAHDFDAVWSNAHWTHAEASVAGRLARTPVVLHLHEQSIPGLGQWLRSGAVRLATRTVAVSRGVATGLPEFARNRISVIPNGVDTACMSPASEGNRSGLDRLRASVGVGPDDVMVLAATRLDPSKRIGDLIAAVDILDIPRIRLVIAGTTSDYPDYERDVRAAAAALPPGRVNFCGIRSDMVALFQASDVMLHAGVVEGMPLGLLEAQACGTPVVAYDVAGVPEAVVHEGTGLLAAPCDVAGLSSALGKLVGDDVLRAEMGAAARAHVLAHHRIETQVARIAAVLTGMCGVPKVMAL